MTDVIDLIFDYRRLLAVAKLGELSPTQRKRLKGLRRLLVPGETDPGWRSHDRVVSCLPAKLDADGVVHPVRVINVSGGGICIQPAPPLKQGEIATLHVESGRGCIYHLAVEARWSRQASERSAMGMPFTGMAIAVLSPRQQTVTEQTPP